MKYMGSKSRIGRHILPLILPHITSTNNYVEPFCGGMNMMQYVPENLNRYANDSNKYVAAMWKELINGWIPPKEISKELYNSCKNLNHSQHVIGYVGINASYSGKWFGGYAGKTKTKVGTVRDYQLEAFKNVVNQIKLLHNVKVCSKSYDELTIPEKSVIYCDPP